jgi:uncharacterized membrane protein YhhN
MNNLLEWLTDLLTTTRVGIFVFVLVIGSMVVAAYGFLFWLALQTSNAAFYAVLSLCVVWAAWVLSGELYKARNR